MQTLTQLPPSPGAVSAGARFETSREPAPTRPIMRMPIDLPDELWLVLSTYLIPTSPFVQKPDDPTMLFPIAGAMRDLRSLSQACTELNRIVARLRKCPAHSHFRELASRIEYTHHKKMPEARAACIERYQVDPLDATAHPQLIQKEVFTSAELDAVCRELRQHAGELRELRLFIHGECELPAGGSLRSALQACASMKKLALSSNAMLSAILLDEIMALPALQSLTLKGASLASGVLARLANATFAPRLQTLILSFSGLTAEDLRHLGAFASQLPALRNLAVEGAPLDTVCCEALAGALPELHVLQSLSLGRHASLSAKGVSILMPALCQHRGLTQLGLHRLDQGETSVPLLHALQKYGRLQELAYGGSLDSGAGPYPWTLFQEGSHLRSLCLDGCGLDPSQWKDLARVIGTSQRLRELHIVGESFTDEGATQLAKAILKKNGRLLRLTIEDCIISTAQAGILRRAVAKSKSLLILQVLLQAGAGDGSEVTRAFSRGAKNSKTLLQFDLGNAVPNGWFEAQPQMRRNALQ